MDDFCCLFLMRASPWRHCHTNRQGRLYNCTFRCNKSNVHRLYFEDFSTHDVGNCRFQHIAVHRGSGHLRVCREGMFRRFSRNSDSANSQYPALRRHIDLKQFWPQIRSSAFFQLWLLVAVLFRNHCIIVVIVCLFIICITFRILRHNPIAHNMPVIECIFEGLNGSCTVSLDGTEAVTVRICFRDNSYVICQSVSFPVKENQIAR